ncbi:MAG: glucokinase [Pseudomonadota bacterium]
MVKRILVADIGGTNTRVAMADDHLVDTRSIQRFRNADHPGIATVLRAYLATQDAKPDAVCVCVAGPVRDGVGALTNLDWSMDGDLLRDATGAPEAALLNDLQAQGHAIDAIAPEHLAEVTTGITAKPDASQLVIGLGTGFNAAPIHITRNGRHVAPSECGHANLPIRTEEELRLCQFVETAHGFPAIEDVLSGRGLERVYHWLAHEAGQSTEKSAKDIMEGAATDPRAQDALRVFIRILGTVAGNLSLVHLPFGGVYLVGGVARAMLPHLAQYGFTEAFRDKGRFAGFMGNFPVSIVLDDYAALTGNAAYMCDPA